MVVGIAVACLTALAAVAGSVDAPVVTSGIGYEVTVPWEALLERGDVAAGRVTGSGANTEPVVRFGPNEISTSLPRLVVFSAWLLVAFRKMDALAGLFTALTCLFALVLVYFATGGGTAATNAPLLGGLSQQTRFLVLAAVILAVVSAIALSLPDRFQRPTDRETVGPALARFRSAIGGERDGSTPREPSPENPVERAWWDVTRRVDRESWATRTPREIEREAADAGLSRAAVRDLRETFEEVRYGGAPASEDRQRRARELRERLDAGDDPGGAGTRDAGEEGSR
jgi:hypothetical protein